MSPDDNGRLHRPCSSLSPSQPLNSSRSSVLSSVVPYLRRLDTTDMPGHHKAPLLTLKLSSPSFLDSMVIDDATTEPLYFITTTSTFTSVRRADPWDNNAKTADIDWPTNAPAKGKGISDGVLIKMRGADWKGTETLLRRGTIRSAPRKFNIPNFSHNLKWRRVGASYWCTTSPVKGPIAILEPALESLPPRLFVFETLHDKYDIRPMLVHHGVSLLLLDYLLVTALLLVTDVQDWMLVKKFEKLSISPSNDALSRPSPERISTSGPQWRKIMFGEPLFPKRASHSNLSSGSTTPDVVTPSHASSEQMAKIVYGDPIYPTLRTSSLDISSSSESEDDRDYMFFSADRARPPSPSAESIFYPLTNSSAPSHTYLDPSFYNKHEIPPVPPIPAIYSTPGAGPSRSPTARPSSSHSTTSTRMLRELPVPPIPGLIQRPRSTPPRAMTSPSPGTREIHSVTGTHHQSLPATRRLPEPSTGRSPSVTRGPLRQLPRPPSSPSYPDTPAQSQRQGPVLGRSRSQILRSREKWQPADRVPRTLPAPPVGGSAGTAHAREREPRRQTWKEVDDDLARANYDTPPPAYSAIDFRSGLDLEHMSSSPSPLPPPLSSRTDV